MRAIYIGSSHCSVYPVICDTALLFEKNSPKYRQIDFLSFIFKLEVRGSSEMFVFTKWTNQVLFCLGYLVQNK